MNCSHLCRTAELRTNQEYTLCANFDFPGQKVRSPGQVKIRCALRDRPQTWRYRAVGTVLVRTFSNFQDEILEWIPTECIFRIFHFNDLRSGQFSTRPIRYISLLGEMTLLPITFEPKVISEWIGYQSIFLVPPNRMLPNMTDLTWFDVWPRIGRSHFEISFLGGKIEYHSILFNERTTIAWNSLM